jgi:YVTN family beta-propeller protein
LSLSIDNGGDKFYKKTEKKMKVNYLLKIILGVCALSNHLSAAVLAYVSNSGSNSVSVIDTSTNSVIRTIPVGFFPTDIDSSPTGSFIYVPLYSDNVVDVINTSTDTLMAGIALPQGSKPISVAIAPNGQAYVTNFSNTTISQIDPSTMMVSTIFPVGAIFPINMAITPNGLEGYVVNAVGPKNVKVVNLSTNTLTATITTSQQSMGVAITPDSSTVYVTNPLSNTVSVISTATHAVTATISLPANSYPRGVEVTPNGAFAYVVNQGTSTVSVINTSTNTITTTITLPSNQDPFNIAFTPDGTLAYVSLTLGNSVAVINTSTNTVTTTVPVGNFPYDVAIVSIP